MDAFEKGLVPVLSSFTNIPARSQVCNITASTAAVADHAKVRGEKLESTSDNHSPTTKDRSPGDAGSTSIAAKSFCMGAEEGGPRDLCRLYRRGDFFFDVVIVSQQVWDFREGLFNRLVFASR